MDAEQCNLIRRAKEGKTVGADSKGWIYRSVEKRKVAMGEESFPGAFHAREANEVRLGKMADSKGRNTKPT